MYVGMGLFCDCIVHSPVVVYHADQLSVFYCLYRPPRIELIVSYLSG